PVTVRNDTGKDGTFEVRLTAAGPVGIEGEAARSVEVKNGAEATTHFDVRTGDAPGESSFTLEASGNGERTVARGVVPLRADLPPHTVEVAGSLAERATTFAVDDAPNFRADTLRRDLRIGRTPLLRFAGQLRTVLHYPYGCTEQAISGAFPLIYLSELAKELDPKLFNERGDPAIVVQDAIRRTGTTQLESGGFALWPQSRELHPWTSVYATHFLAEARRAGYAVEGFLHDRALEWLAAEAKAKEQYGRDELERVVYALYVLSRAGKADTGTLDFVREKHLKELRPDSRALLAAAYAQAGNREGLEELLQGIDDAEVVERQTDYNFASTIRNRALLLLAFLDVAADDPRVAKLVQRLARDAETTPWWTTQESAFALLALGQFFQRQAEKG
ncbi:MAG: alpha-2-macroglobulin family protein, partial [Candidatus Binatia bacterium]